MSVPDAGISPIRSLFVFDAGEWTLSGCTADEVEQLLADPRSGRSPLVYRIHRAYPDGRMELQGVSRERFELESGLFFHRAAENAARADFAALTALAADNPPPSRAYAHLAHLADGAENAQWVTALIYPAEAEEEISAWLLNGGYEGGAFVEGGITAATSYLSRARETVERQQLWAARQAGRSTDELFEARNLKSAG